MKNKLKWPFKTTVERELWVTYGLVAEEIKESERGSSWAIKNKKGITHFLHKSNGDIESVVNHLKT